MTKILSSVGIFFCGLVLVLPAAVSLTPAGEPASARVIHGARPRRVRVSDAQKLPRIPESAKASEGRHLVPNRFGLSPGSSGEPIAPLVSGDGPARLTLVPDAPALGESAPDAAGFPDIDTRFDGPYQSGLAPPDPVMTVGRNHVVSLINQRIEMYDKSGNSTSGPTSLKTFFGIPSGFSIFDPLAIHDAFADRYVVTTLARNSGAQDSRIYIAFSQTDDPNGSWNVYWIDADDGQAGNWADYSSIGIDRLGVYITANMWSASGDFQNVTIFIYDQADGYAGTPLDHTHLIDVRTSGGTSPFILRPAEVVENVPGDEYFLAHANNAFSDKLELFRLTGDRYASPSLETNGVSLSGVYFGPGDARQPGSFGVDTLGAQLWNVYYRGGKIWTGQTISGNSDIVAWVHRLDAGQNPAVREETYEVSATDRDTYFPYVLPDREDNDFALMTAFSGADLYVTGRYWNIGADGTVRSAELLTNGTRENTSERYGDYFAINEDPADGNRIWMIAQYMKNSSFSGNQIIASVRFEDVAPPTPPPPVPDGQMTAGQEVTVSKAAGGDVTVAWDATTCPATGSHLVWYDLGAISLYTIAEETCDIGTTGTWTGPPAAGNVALIVVGEDPGSATEGSHGVASDGSERSSQSAICTSQKDTSGTCVP